MAKMEVRCFDVNDLPKEKIPEFDRQLQGQEYGLNEFTVEEYLNSRKMLGSVKRDRTVAGAARSAYEEKLIRRYTSSEFSTGVDQQ